MSREQVMDFYNNDSSRPFEMSFGQNGKTVGTMRFNGDVMTFEGEADSAATVFIDMIVKKQSAQWEEATSRISELEAKCAALAAENAGLKADHVRIFNSGYQRGHESTVEGYYVDIHQNDITTYHEDIVSEIAEEQTPATDAFLAEVRAQGVDMAACALDDVNQFNYAKMLDDLAQKLRQDASTADLVAAGIGVKGE